MRILISNDDGVLAAGIAALRGAVADMADVTVVAPDSPQSAAGHGITVHNPLTVRRLDIGAAAGLGGFQAMSVDGRPADCVRLAIKELLDGPPDLVLAGINAGANVGINVFYSGTVAAAAEAAMLGYPAVAFSAAVPAGGSLKDEDFAKAGKICRAVLGELMSVGLKGGDLINVNVPAPAEDNPKGLRVVPQSTAEVEDVYKLQETGGVHRRYRLEQEYTFAPGEAETDVADLALGYVTVTPLHFDMTEHNRLAQMQKRTWAEIKAD